MKAAVITEYGGPEVLRYADHPDPVAGDGEVLVRIHAAGVNPVDTMERSGRTRDWKPIRFPGVLGWDLAGTVEKVGPGVTRLAVGDEVFGWAWHAYAELCAVNEGLLARIPEGLDIVDAAALPLVTLTGTQLVSVASRMKPGQRVLVSGALGGVGRAAVFTAKDRGAFVIAGVQRKTLAEGARLGADEVIALDDPAQMDALRPVDVVANAVRGSTAEALFGKVRSGGVFASATGVPANAKDFPEVEGIAFVSRQNLQDMLYMANAVRDGRLAIPIGRRLALRDAAEAHRLVEKGGSGKLVLLP